MEEPINIQTKRSENISQKYRLLEHDIQQEYGIHLVHYREDEIHHYHVIYWHRLLRKIYGSPQEFECNLLKKNVIKPVQPQTAIFRKTEEDGKWTVHRISEENLLKLKKGEIQPMRINWKYFVQLPTGGILELATKDNGTAFYIGLIIINDDIRENDEKEANKFISILLEEANRLKDQLFNPKREFAQCNDLKLYHLLNVYLSNYVTAEEMLALGDTQEPRLLDEFLRYDARTDDLLDDKKRKHIDKFMLLCGMYYNSAIIYFFMALEGFINIVFHAFLKQILRDKDLNIEQRLDFELKMRLMPILCSCFRDEQNYLTSELYENFKKLKKYRNNIFHSKAEEALTELSFLEDGFMYNFDMEEYKDVFLPLNKIKLTKEDVIEVKAFLGEVVNITMNLMTENAKILTEKYILNEKYIPFWISDNGQLFLGETIK